MGEEKGAAALEFALAAPIYIALLLLTIETGVAMGMERYFESAVTKASREIRTGEAQRGGGLNVGELRRRLCDELLGVFDCARMRIDLDTFASFEEISLPPTIDEDGNVIEDEVFTPPEPDQLVAMRARYVWPIFGDIFGIGLSNTASGDRQFVAVHIFKTEPYGE